jgi:hypothetical protein
VKERLRRRIQTREEDHLFKRRNNKRDQMQLKEMILKFLTGFEAIEIFFRFAALILGWFRRVRKEFSSIIGERHMHPSCRS